MDLVKTALYYVLLVGLPTALVFLGLTRIGRRRPPWLDLLFAAVVPLAALLVCSVLAQRQMVVVAINDREIPTEVTGREFVLTGTVNPPDASVHVLVRPATEDVWWVQPPVTKWPSGAWESKVNLGTDTSGTSDDYLIVAIGSTMPRLLGVLANALPEGRETLHHLPPLPSSRAHIVRRRP